MARFEEGHARLPGAGRQKGRPNNATRNAREAIARLIDGNIDRLQGWLDEIAEKQGAFAALRCLLDLLEYHVPKLTRAELTVDKSSDEKPMLESSKLSYEDRQALKGILERYDAITRRATAPYPGTDDDRDADEGAAVDTAGVGGCDG